MPHCVLFIATVSLASFSFVAGAARADDYPIEQWKAWDAGAGDRFPGKTWSRFAAPEEAGWSAAKLEEARKYSEEIGSAAVLVVYDGAVLAQWGDTSRRYMCHSMRKSLLSALVGMHVAAGDMDLDKTLAELGIDDRPPLTTQEKQARVIDLLRSRSGVYHTAAYETPRMKTDRPARDSHRPGEFFWYNNWDFNALGAIFERETGTKIFEEFRRRFAEPLGMQDYRARDGYYHLERRQSIYPAYPFRMSSRDLARFGLLYLRRGCWADQRILSEDWIDRSVASHFRPGDSTRIKEYGYGYLWWPIIHGPLAGVGMYSARGSGGHAIDVIPGANLVVVHRVDTFWDVSELGKTTKHSVDEPLRFELIDRVLRARVGPPKQRPKLIDIVDNPRPAAADLSDDVLARYVGRYDFGKLKLDVKRGGDGLLVGNSQMGQFDLTSRSASEFFVEDVEAPVTFAMAPHGRPTAVSIEFIPGKPLRGHRVGN
ncbi:MAG: serine hydrolase [Pirellulales bacterium]|nr:serine hydrolase [Pirellulales bacterium]